MIRLVIKPAFVGLIINLIINNNQKIRKTMKVQETITKSKEIFYLLDVFRSLSNNQNKVEFAKGLKNFVETVNRNNNEMKEVFSNMKICAENEANRAEEENKLNRIKALVDSLESKIKVLRKVKKNYDEYVNSIDTYLQSLGKSGRKRVPKEISDNFKEVKMEIIGIINVLCLLKSTTDFEKLLSVSQFQSLEMEIKKDK